MDIIRKQGFSAPTVQPHVADLHLVTKLNPMYNHRDPRLRKRISHSTESTKLAQNIYPRSLCAIDPNIRKPLPDVGRTLQEDNVMPEKDNPAYFKLSIKNVRRRLFSACSQGVSDNDKQKNQQPDVTESVLMDQTSHGRTSKRKLAQSKDENCKENDDEPPKKKLMKYKLIDRSERDPDGPFDSSYSLSKHFNDESIPVNPQMMLKQDEAKCSFIRFADGLDYHRQNFLLDQLDNFKQFRDQAYRMENIAHQPAVVADCMKAHQRLYESTARSTGTTSC